MKLSTKLLLGLLGIILLFIIIQIIYSERITNDLNILNKDQSIETISTLKTMHPVSLEAFNEIEVSDRIPVKILKGSKYALFHVDYAKTVSIRQEKNKLLINADDSLSFDWIKKPVYIYLPEEPKTIIFHTNYRHYSYSGHEICGFNGAGTRIIFHDGNQTLSTDLPFLNIQQKDNDLNLHLINKDSLTTKYITLKIASDNSHLNLISDNSHLNLKKEDSKTTAINLDLHVNKSSFNIHVKSDSLKLPHNIKIKGTVEKRPESSIRVSKYNRPESSNTLYCDTFLLDITKENDTVNFRILLPRKIEAKSYFIQNTNNVKVREE